MDDCAESIEKMQDQIKKENTKDIKTEQGQERRDWHVKDLKAGISDKERFMEAISTWGVILYDAGK